RIGWPESQMLTEDAIRDVARDPDAAVRREALLTLAVWGHPAAEEIRELLHEPPAADVPCKGPRWEPGPQVAALNAIIRLGPASVDNLHDLVALLPDEGELPRQWREILAALRGMKS